MKKRFEELTEQEQLAFVKELARMQNFGSACIIASAINLQQEDKGWPLISIESSGETIQIPLCDSLDILRDSSRMATLLEIREITSGLFGFLFQSAIPDPEEFAVHSALHDAFCLGIAAVSLLEMDFSGVEDILAQINTGNTDV